jgi:signal transduction histidine kinase
VSGEAQPCRGVVRLAGQERLGIGLRLVDGSLSNADIDVDDARAHTDEVRTLVAQALDEVRQLAFELRPTVLDDVGLVAAVRRLAGNVSERSGVPVRVALDGVDDDTRMPPEVETVVYRVVQEALTNVARHAQASHAAVELALDDHSARARIVDDGPGFTLDDSAARSLGLAGMSERASLVDGHLEIVSAPGEGTTVLLEVPQ